MRTLLRLGLASLLVFAGVLSLRASQSSQQPQNASGEEFQAATVTRSPARTVSVGGVTLLSWWRGAARSIAFNADRMAIRNLTLRQLVWLAYNRPLPHQADSSGAPTLVEGGPTWVDSDTFDIEATMPPGTSNDRYPAMLRALLRDRFTLVTTVVAKDMPAKALVVRDPRRAGSRLHRSTVECPLIDFLSITSGKSGQPRACALVVNDRADGLTSIQGRGVGMPFFAKYLSSKLVPVFDQTGLTGAFDFDLEHRTTVENVDGPSASRPIEASLHEQLGLTLRGTRAPREVRVIVSAEPPR